MVPQIRRLDYAALTVILLVSAALFVISLHSSHLTNWIFYGALMFTFYAPLLAWRAGGISLFAKLMLIAIGALFPVWCSWTTILVWIPLSWVCSAWPVFGEAISGFVAIGGIQGLFTAIALAFICRSLRLSSAIALAIIPAYLLGSCASESIPPPPMNTIGPPIHAEPFLPPIIVLWNMFVAVSMWVWACHTPRTRRESGKLSRDP